jgi:hypothetical protein
MSMAKKIAYQIYLKKHGIKIAWMAQELAISEELLRYHMARGFDKQDELRDKFRAVLKAHAIALLEDLDFLPQPAMEAALSSRAA